MMKKHLSKKTIVLAVFAALANVAHAGVIFSENFDSYTAGSNLSGQGGWSGDALTVGPSTGLGSSSALGTTGSGGTLNFTVHSLAALSLTQKTTLSYEAFAVDRSHDSGIMFTEGLGGAQFRGGWFLDVNSGGWTFDARGLSGNVQPFQQHVGAVINKPIKLDLIIDPIALDVFGRGNFGSGFIETTHYSIDPTFLAKIDGITIFEDYRGTLGVDIDNISVSIPDPNGGGVPEPTSLLLLSLGLAMLVSVSRVRR
jgi:hypothetical protein